MVIKDSYISWFVRRLHHSHIFRTIAKQVFRGFIIKQSFYKGMICLDAVEYSWAWLGNDICENFGHELQDKLLFLSKEREVMIDIGCNVGLMALSVLLRNTNIKAVCVDPNPLAIVLLNKSMRINRLSQRMSIIEAAVGVREGVIRFDQSRANLGMSHVSASGSLVRSISFLNLINSHSCSAKCLVKIDIEGFETILMRQLAHLANLHNLCFVIELHALGYNSMGNPKECLKLLKESGAVIEGLSGSILSQVEEDRITQVIVRWNRE